MKDYVLNRLREASTWRGLIFLMTAIGVRFTAVQSDALLALGLAIAGVIGVFSPDSKK